MLSKSVNNEQMENPLSFLLSQDKNQYSNISIMCYYMYKLNDISSNTYNKIIVIQK